MRLLATKILATVAAIAILAGCSGDDERMQRLKVYNWGDYIDEELLAEFEEWYKEHTGREVEVVYQTFDINEVMLAKIENGHADFRCLYTYSIICNQETEDMIGSIVVCDDGAKFFA